MRRPLALTALSALAVAPVLGTALAACGSTGDSLGPGPQGSDQPGAVVSTTMAGQQVCERQGLYRLSYPDGWTANEDCTAFTPPGGTGSTGTAGTTVTVPAITVEAVTQTYEDLVAADVGPGATREEVALGPARAEKVTYTAGAAAGGGGATPVVRYTVDLVPGVGSAATSDEQALIMSAVGTTGVPVEAVTAVLDQMAQTIEITAYRPERGDPEPQ